MISAPMFEEPLNFRAALNDALPGIRIVGDGDLPDHAIDVIIVDDHSELRHRNFPNVSMILSLSAGVDRLLATEICPDARVARLLTPEHQWLMREYVVHHILRAHNHLLIAEEQQRRRCWDWLPPAVPVAGSHALVLGLGYLGGPCAEVLRDLGLSVTGWSRSARIIRGIRSVSGQEALLDALVDADYVVCLLPLTTETLGILGATRLPLLPERAIVINASRAGCVDQAALVSMLEKGSLAGAVLDVLDTEPLPATSPLWTVPNLTLTPHSAAVPTGQAYIPVIIDAVRRFLKGQEIANTVDRSRGY